ncbi:hypothetical protein AB0I81_25070 [Nonomuraea sp. NPDC050404]|uniref:hypothetical protein n=1 Tax=Nonomuraea sp. NPDC050404 TaxID=3155783 RepID=UPI0033F5D1EF
MTSTRQPRPAIAALYTGLGLTLVALLLPYVNGAALSGHIRAGYPSYDQARIGTAVTTWLIYLSVLGALGILGWLCAIWAAGTRKPWARRAATALLPIGAGIALFNLLIRDTSGDTGLPPLLGWTGLLPCLAGLAAVALMWTKQPR